MPKLRVLATLPNLHGGGAEKIALHLMNGLDPDRFDRTIFVHERQGSYIETLADGAPVIFQNEAPYRRSQLPGSFLGTLRQARRSDIVIGANEGRASLLALLAARLTGKPIILWIHVDWSRFSGHVSWRQKLALGLYRRADSVVAVSDGVAASFARQFPGSADIVTTIHNGIPAEEIEELSREPLDAEHEAIFADPVVVAVGRLDHQKGHEFLIAAHAMVRRRGIFHRLVLIGDGGLRARLKDQARTAGVADTVHMLGFQRNPYRFMRRATVFAHSARFEGFALVIAEALACGVPVVSTDCPSGPREILEGGAWGILVENENAGAMASALERVLTDPDERQRLAVLARKRAPDFGMSAMVGRWEALIQRLTRDGARRPGAARAQR